MPGRDGASSPFGVALRGWRERADPVRFGLPVHRRRRVPGLSRTELARLSGLSVDYVKLLEQGRGSTPSAQVVSALARALRLSSWEREYLFRCAGQLPPRGDVPLEVDPAVERIVAGLSDRPALIVAPDWTVLGWNDMWVAAAGDPAKYDWPFDNLIAAVFLNSDGRTVEEIGPWPVRVGEGPAATETALVGDLRFAAATYPADRRLAAMIERMLAGPRFAELWRTGTGNGRGGRPGRIEHPVAGEIRVEGEVMMAPGSDQRIQTLIPPPRTPDAARFDLLRRDIRPAGARRVHRMRPREAGDPGTN
ncbi:helix-turn-helix domain-containing protein [Actinoplanes sp. NPDC049265]|uniref:helix-turn-helix domain-containing protein n=1 Tax=Actinoplanes sp. NPDC049265 TaxID=3363902 RepID=UPI003721CB6E